jgi:type I restriction enzyme S subunit
MEVKPGYKQTEVGVIPEEWDVKPLADIADKIMVGIASAATHAYRVKGVPMFRNQNIKAGQLEDTDLLFVAPEYEATFKNKRLRAGDLLTMRTGYPGVTAIVPPKYDSAQSFTTLITRPNQREAESPYLCHYVNSEMGQQFFTQSQIGGAQKNVNVATLRKMPVPIPKLPEQRAIAAALSDVDGLLGGLDRLIAKKRDLKQAAMQQLLTGQTRLPGFHGEWEETTLGKIGKFKNGLNKDSSAFGHGSPFVNLMDVFGVNSISSASHLGLVASTKMDREVYDLRQGDVLFIRSSVKPSGVGLTAVVERDLTDTVYSGFLIRFRDEGALDNGFKKHCFYAETFRNKIIAASSVSANTNINQNALGGLTLLLPPTKAEQTAIAEVLSEMDGELAVLEQRREKTRALKQAMMQELLTGRTRLL